MRELQDLKVVMTQKGDKVTVGVNAADCDPVVAIVPGTMEETIPMLADLIGAAKTQWEASPRYPKSERELPKPPVRTPDQSNTPAGKSTPKKEKSPQNKLF